MSHSSKQEIPNYLTKSQNISDRIEGKENKKKGWKKAKNIPKENNTPEFKRYPYGKNEPCNKPAKRKAYIVPPVKKTVDASLSVAILPEKSSKVATNANANANCNCQNSGGTPCDCCGPPPPCNCTGPCNCERKCCNLEKQCCLKFPSETCFPYGGFTDGPYSQFNGPTKVVPPTGKTCNFCIEKPKKKIGDKCLCAKIPGSVCCSGTSRITPACGWTTCVNRPIPPLKILKKPCAVVNAAGNNAGIAGITNSRNWIEPGVTKSGGSSCGCHKKGYTFAPRPFAGNLFHEKLLPYNHIVAKPGCSCPPPFGNQQYKDIDFDENTKTPPTPNANKSSPFVPVSVAASGQFTYCENNGVTRTGLRIPAKVLAKARAKEAYARENRWRKPHDRFNLRPRIIKSKGISKILVRSKSKKKIGSKSSKSKAGISSSSNSLSKSKTGSSSKVEKNSSKESNEFKMNDFEDDVDKKEEDSVEEVDGTGRKFSINSKGEKSEIVDENEDKVEASKSKISNKSKVSTSSKGSNKSNSSKGSKTSGGSKGSSKKSGGSDAGKDEDNDEEINDP